MAYRAGVRTGTYREKSRWLISQGAANQNAFASMAEMNHEESITRSNVQDALRNGVDVAIASDELSNFEAHANSTDPIASPTRPVRSEN